jgi:hypothetical protein
MNIKLIKVGFAAVLFALGCGKSEGGSAESSSGNPPKAAAVAAGGIAASCVKGTTVCVEYKNAIPDFAEEMCKAGPDYVFRKGSAACPTDKLLGKCTSKATPDEISYWYGGPEEADVDKGICEVLGQWTPAAAKTSAAATTKPNAATPPPPAVAPKRKK